MRMYPFWKLDGEAGVFKLTGFAGLKIGEERMVIGLFNHLEGGLTEARRSTAGFEGATEATLEETEATPGGAAAVADWRALPEEDL